MPVRSVVLVDDDPDIRTVCELALTLVGGWKVTLAASGPEGLEAARRERPDLVVLDVMMPGMDGLATLAALRADPETGHLPVVLMTARLQPGEAGFADADVQGVIPKPFDPMTLPARLKELVVEARR